MALPPRMQAARDKWLAARRLDRCSSTVTSGLAVRVFGLARRSTIRHRYVPPEVTRDHCLDWIGHLAETRRRRLASRWA